MAKGTQRDWEIKEALGRVGVGGGWGFQPTAGQKGSRLLRTDDLPAGFANAPQVQGLYSLSLLSKCIRKKANTTH